MEWISVKDRLPEKIDGDSTSDWVLLWNGLKTAAGCYVFSNPRRWHIDVILNETNAYKYTPTHWMPLPRGPIDNITKDWEVL